MLPVLVVRHALAVIFLRRKHRKEQVRHVDGDVLHRFQISPLRILVLQRRRLLPPLQGIVSPDGLRIIQDERHRVIRLQIVVELVQPRE